MEAEVEAAEAAGSAIRDDDGGDGRCFRQPLEVWVLGTRFARLSPRSLMGRSALTVFGGYAIATPATAIAAKAAMNLILFMVWFLSLLGVMCFC